MYVLYYQALRSMICAGGIHYFFTEHSRIEIYERKRNVVSTQVLVVDGRLAIKPNHVRTVLRGSVGNLQNTESY